MLEVDGIQPDLKDTGCGIAYHSPFRLTRRTSLSVSSIPWSKREMLTCKPSIPIVNLRIYLAQASSL